MISNSKALLFGLISTALALFQTCGEGINFDYTSMPAQPFAYEHMDLSLTLEPDDHLVRGVVQYELTAKQYGLSTLTMNIAESAVDGATINDEAADYRVEEDKLIILLPDTTRRGEEYSVSVIWQSNSPFGLYKDHQGTFWSSKNPLAHRHWIPGFDHPRNELTFTAEFIIPIGTEILFNGTLEDSEVYSANRKKVRYSSDTAVPFSGLGFANGDFNISEVTSGLNKIRLFASEEGYNEEERAEILREASSIKKDIENELTREFPWEGLNIVILPDNFWEERTHGTGTIFMYENLGSLSSQLKRGLYAQWLGEFHRQEQYFDFSGTMDFSRTALHYLLNDSSALIGNPDSLISIYEWNVWQQGFIRQDPLVQNVVKGSLPELIRQPAGVQAFANYSEYWYQETGIPFKNLSYPEISNNSEVTERVSSDTEYALDAFYDERTSELLLIFTLTGGSGEELYTLDMTAFEFSDSSSTEVSFTGVLDTVNVSLSPAVEYIVFKGDNINMDQIVIDEYPLFFLTNQLRSDDPGQRIRAAKLLSNYTDNPDIQLALNDILGFETNPEVRAALLSAMSAFTQGATGTEQQFLDNLNSSDESLQITALEALVNYPQNDMVRSGVRSTVLRAESDSVFKQAVRTYREIATRDEIISLAKRLQRTDNSKMKVLEYIRSTMEQDTSSEYVAMSTGYLNAEQPYPVRRTAFDILLQLNEDEVFWMDLISEMREDRDPRVRFLSLSAIRKLSTANALKVLNAAEQGEYDARILLKADELKQTLAQ